MTALPLHTARMNMSDAMERDFLRGTLEDQPNARPLNGLKTAGRAVLNGINGVFSFIDEVSESMNRARAASARYAGSQW